MIVRPFDANEREDQGLVALDWPEDRRTLAELRAADDELDLAPGLRTTLAMLDHEKTPGDA